MWSQLPTCSNATEVAKWVAPSCSRSQPATDNGVRDGRSNWLAVTLHLAPGSTPWAPRIARCKCGLQIARLAAATGARTRVLGYARPTHCLCSHSGYNIAPNPWHQLFHLKLLNNVIIFVSLLSTNLFENTVFILFIYQVTAVTDVRSFVEGYWCTI